MGSAEPGFAALSHVCPEVLLRFDAAARGLRLLVVPAEDDGEGRGAGGGEWGGERGGGMGEGAQCATL
jgi:hypothetical protein